MQFIEIPTLSQYRFGLASVANEVVTQRDDGFHFWQYCGRPNIEATHCEPFQKVETPFDFNETATGFTVQAMVQCEGSVDPDAEKKAMAALNAGESYALEVASAAQITDVLAGAPADADAAIAIAEQEGDFLGQRILHMSRGVATMASNIDRHGNKLETDIGSFVSAGFGYEDGRVYASGRVFFTRGQAIARSAFNSETNLYMAVAERVYFVAVECPIGYVDIV